VSLARGGGSGKVGVTARQPFLGKLEWIEHDVEKLRSAEVEKAKKSKVEEKEPLAKPVAKQKEK